MVNTDQEVVADFGLEWTKFNQSGADRAELKRIFDDYFAIFPWAELGCDAEGFDLGCGSGRWAYFVAQRVGRLHCIDPSAEALEVATRKLSDYKNCEFHCASVDSIPLPDSSADFGYSLGVLHHVPDTQQGINECVRRLKVGSPFLLYLYYAFDNRPAWFRMVWRTSNAVRMLICKLPFSLKSRICDLLAALVYWPLARFAKLLNALSINSKHFPLSSYRDRSFYTMRTDALDRFGTKLEKRFTREEMRSMMQGAGLERISFSDKVWWCAVGYRSR